MDKKELFEMLTSTMWQDYKGYKRDLNLKSYTEEFIKAFFFATISVFCTIICYTEGDIFYVIGSIPLTLALACIYKIICYIIRWHRISKVNSVAYDIELSSTAAKMIRTKKQRYGIVCDCSSVSDDDTYLRLILSPKYNMIERVDDDCFIISSTRHFSQNLRYGIYNSSLRKITVPIRFDKISRPNDSANLYIAEKKGETYKFNSMGDRIVR